ncbi:hypothetical protein HY643_00280 [Candidatus Woesearchaeota archaeon]|nr:hypothetical protein [Candidatus Woesearchaeota archaeon]
MGLVNAITEQEIEEAKTLIDSKADCGSLSDSQLEIIGEYYMEQMHPGEAHKLMHKMMGFEEDSAAEEQFHISMAKRIYCNKAVGGMMGYGGMMGMIGGGMMNMMGGGNMMNYGMMGGTTMMGNVGWGIYGLFWFALLSLAFSIIFWLTYNWLAKKENAKKR